ncbi:MAG: hypothetical protein IPN59_01530 [Holophaga sp.]|nr:hypothetical protein [Holophaga sp.]
MVHYAVENLDTATGRRTELPFRFPSRAEAQAKLEELIRAQPGKIYIVKLVPAA